MINVILNGEAREIAREINLTELLKLFSLPDERIAVELNKAVVRKKDWQNIKISDGDRLEIIHFVGGG